MWEKICLSSLVNGHVWESEKYFSEDLKTTMVHTCTIIKNTQTYTHTTCFLGNISLFTERKKKIEKAKSNAQNMETHRIQSQLWILIWIPYLPSLARNFFYSLIDHLILSLLSSNLWHPLPFLFSANDTPLHFIK